MGDARAVKNKILNHFRYIRKVDINRQKRTEKSTELEFRKRSNMRSYSKLIASLLICIGGGWLSGLATNAGLNTWYPHLIKATLTPPSIAFPIVWTILYFLMGLSLYLIWSRPFTKKTPALFFFFLQLFFNFIWSFIFFYCENPGLALIDLTFLWFSIVWTMVLFFRLEKSAGYLLVPYLAWVSFAFYLNYFIWMNN